MRSSTQYLADDVTEVIDASGNITATQFQAFDTPDSMHPTVISAPQGQTTTISRNVFSDPVSATQSGGGVSLTRSMIYDSYERLCKQVDPEKGQTVFYYDAASRISWEAEGQAGSPTACDYGSVPTTAQIAFTYDPLNRKTAINYPDSSGNVTYGYDPDGHFQTSVNPTASLTYTYDKRGLLQSEVATIDQGGGTLTYGYTPQANLATKTTPSGLQLSYSPDAWGEPTTITNATTNTAYASNILYYPNGTPSAYTFGNGLTYAAALDSRQRLQQQQVKNGGTLLQSLAYGYNNDNDLLSITDGVNGSSGDTASFTPDGLHRLSTANGLWGSYTYGYDALNNLTSRTGSAPLSYTYNYTYNQLTSITGAQSRSNTYDAVGHVTADGTYRYTWNDADQITAIPGVATYYYDANGKRAKRNTASASEYDFYDLSGSLAYRYELYSNTQTDEIQLAGQTVAEVSSVLVTGTPTFIATYLHPDLLGSPRLATNSSGAVLWTQHYDPYGTRMGSVNEKIGYTGHSFDAESNLTYAKARYYDPVIGRFLSTDPASFSTANPFSFSRYAYGNDSPYNYKDLNGKSPVEIAFLIADSVQLGVAVSSGQDIGMAVANVAIDVAAVASPIPGISEVAHTVEAGEAAEHVAEAAKEVAEAASEGKAQIVGTAQSTKSGGEETTHASTSERIADESQGGTAYLNKSLTTATNGEIKSNMRGDVTHVLRDDQGNITRVNINEVLSPKQNPESQSEKWTDITDSNPKVTVKSHDPD